MELVFRGCLASILSANLFKYAKLIVVCPHTREGKVLAPKKTRSRNVEQDIPQIREERPFVAFVVSPPVRVNSHHFWLYDILNQKGVSLAVNLSGIVVAGFLVLEQLLKFISDSLTIGRGESRFQ